MFQGEKMDAKFKPEVPSKLPDAMQILRASQVSVSDVDSAVKDWDDSFPGYAGLLSALPIRESQTEDIGILNAFVDTGGD